MKDAGIIGFIPRGEYSPTETYDFLQFVYYGDSTYVAKKETTGNPPAENNEYWQILAKGRVLGVSGVKGGEETDYRTGDVNITAENVGALSTSGGTLTNASDISVVKMFSDALTQGTRHIGGFLIGANSQELVRIQAEAAGEQVNFWIQDRVLNKDIFKISSKEHWINHDGAIKNILLEGDKSGSINLPRIDAGDANYKPGKDIFEVKEFGSKSSNMPTAHYYHILTGQGNDFNEQFATQLALGMTTEAMYYRAMMSDSFKKWHKVAFDEVPTVKETTLVIGESDIRVEGTSGGVRTDITDTFIKANTYKEGIIIGVSSNRMGYVRSNNFSIVFSRLTDDEKTLMQSFETIKIYVPNNSPNYPILKPIAVNHDVGCRINNEKITTKMAIGADGNQIYYTYVMPKEFREHDISKNLIFYTEDWEALVGINIKDY